MNELDFLERTCSVAREPLVKMHKLFVLLALFRSCSGQVLFEIDERSENLLSAVNLIVQEKFFQENPPAVSIIALTQDSIINDFKNRLLLRAHSANGIFLLNEHTRNDKSMQNFIFILHDANSVRKLQNEINLRQLKIHATYLCVFVDAPPNELESLFTLMWQQNIFNVNVLFGARNDSIIAVMTFFPFASNECRNTEPKHIASFINGTFDVDLMKLYPEKLQNLHQCPLNITTFEDAPAVIKKKVVKLSDKSFELTGYDIELINELSSALNFKKVIKFLDYNEPWGAVYENGSTRGSFRELATGNADLIIGNLFLKSSRAKHFDHSHAYFIMPVVFVIPDGKLLSPFEKLFQPFDTAIWLLLLGTFAGGLITIFVVNWKFAEHKALVFGKDVKSPAINMLTAILGQSQTVLPERTFSRLLLMLFVMFCLVMRSLYQGSLFKFLQSDGRHKEVQSVDEMIKRDFKFFMFGTSVELIQGNLEIYMRTHTVPDDVELWKHISYYGAENEAILTAMTRVIKMNVKYHKTFVLRICREIEASVSIVIYYRKDFYLINEINKKIQVFISSGIVDFWIKKHLDMRFLYFQNDIRGPQKLSLQHLTGAFDILIVCYPLWCIVFTLEILFDFFCKKIFTFGKFF
jgi:Ligated ion channel L-glutamate- and glycine-binding site